MFIDKVTIKVIAGQGGRGCVAFRREKGVPKGGPSGGDGGRGGSIVLHATGDLRTLIDFQFRPEFRAKHGEHGLGSRCHGEDAKDLIVRVPLGTLAREPASGQTLGDLVVEGQRIVAARGGRGGRGNQHFANSRAQTPKWAEPGMAGEERLLDLELRVLADVGLLGMPNAGKSLLLSKISAAHPKVADYPFTTKEPQLGVVSLGLGESFVVADLPGLIEGAHRGVGLGHEFLRHISRTRVLVHMVDVGTEKPVAELIHDYEAVLEELQQYDPAVRHKPRVLAANKLDLPGAQKRYAALRRHAIKGGLNAKECLAVSALTGKGIRGLLRETQRMLASAPVPDLTFAEGPVVLTPRGRPLVKVIQDQQGNFLVRGRELERVMATVDVDAAGAWKMLQGHFARLGVETALAQAGARRGDRVQIGDLEFEYLP